MKAWFSRTLEQLRTGFWFVPLVIRRILDVAHEAKLVVDLAVKPGDHLLETTVVAHLSPVGAITEKVVDELRTALYLGRERTPTQDIRFQFQQLTDVVIRALSPGINDPFTANSGIAEITVGLLELCKHDTRPRHLRARDGVTRVIAPAATVADVLDAPEASTAR